VVSIASTKGEIEITDPGATIEIMGQGLPTGTTVRGLTTVQGLTIMMRSKGLEEHHERDQARHDGHEGDDVDRLLTAGSCVLPTSPHLAHPFSRRHRLAPFDLLGRQRKLQALDLGLVERALRTGRWKLDGYALRNSGYGWRNSYGPRNGAEAAPVLLAAVSAFRGFHDGRSSETKKWGSNRCRYLLDFDPGKPGVGSSPLPLADWPEPRGNPMISSAPNR
jgi:hypothetical protein